MTQPKFDDDSMLREAFARLGMSYDSFGPPKATPFSLKSVPTATPMKMPLPEGWPFYREQKTDDAQLSQAFIELGIVPPPKAGEHMPQGLPEPGEAGSPEAAANTERGRARLSEMWQLTKPKAAEGGLWGKIKSSPILPTGGSLDDIFRALDITQAGSELGATAATKVLPDVLRGRGLEFEEALGEHLNDPWWVRYPTEAIFDPLNLVLPGGAAAGKALTKGGRAVPPILRGAQTAEAAGAVKAAPIDKLKIKRLKSEFANLARRTGEVDDAMAATGPRTPEQEALVRGKDWRQFSEARGYTAENMAEFEQYLAKYDEARAAGISEYDLMAISERANRPPTGAALSPRPDVPGPPLSSGAVPGFTETAAETAARGRAERLLERTPDELMAIGEARAARVAQAGGRPLMNPEPLTMAGPPPVAGGMPGNEYIPPPSIPERVKGLFAANRRPPVTPLSQLSPATGDALTAKVVTALGESSGLRAKLEPEVSAELGRRATRAGELFQQTAGTVEERTRMARGAFSGPLPTKAFEPIGGKLDATERSELLSRVAEFPGFNEFEKRLRGPDALEKLLTTGQLLQPNEIDLLEEVFPALGGRLRTMHETGWQTFARNAIDFVNIPKALKATADMSAPLRQGFLLLSEVPQTAKALGTMFKAGFSETEFTKAQAMIRQNKYYQMAKHDKLALLGTSSDINKREEAFISRTLQQKIGPRAAAGPAEAAVRRGADIVLTPVRLVTRASERAYVGFLNTQRMGVYENYARLWELPPDAPVATVAQYKREMAQVARNINVFSGRGYLGPAEPAANLLNVIAFSPRLVAARFEAPLMPLQSFVTKTPRAGRMAARNLFASFGATAGMMTLVKYSGVADVEVNPNSPDFGKARVGNTRLDLFAGFQQVARLISQMISEKQKAASGKVSPKTRFAVAEQFGLNKLAPVPGALVGWMKESAAPVKAEKPTEKQATSFYPTDWPGRLEQLLMPMSIDDLWQAIEEDGAVGAALAAPAFLGAGVGSYKDKPAKGRGTSSWK